MTPQTVSGSDGNFGIERSNKASHEYRDNKNRVQRAWSDRNPDYWRNYRKANPDEVGEIQTSSTQSQADLAWIFGRTEANPDFARRMEFSPELAEACQA